MTNLGSALQLRDRHLWQVMFEVDSDALLSACPEVVGCGHRNVVVRSIRDGRSGFGGRCIKRKGVKTFRLGEGLDVWTWCPELLLASTYDFEEAESLPYFSTLNLSRVRANDEEVCFIL